jgi:hypothetical protein
MAIGIAYVDGRRLARSISAAADWVSAGREEINRLNVFPVPDGDTGTNFSLTLRSVADALTALGRPAGHDRPDHGPGRGAGGARRCISSAARWWSPWRTTSSRRMCIPIAPMPSSLIAARWGTEAATKADDMRAQHRLLKHLDRRPVAAVTDSSADLPDAVLDRHHIAMVPLQPCRAPSRRLRRR